MASSTEQRVLEILKLVWPILPIGERKYLCGYLEGALAMANSDNVQEHQDKIAS